ncbi:MAG: polyprenyl synthetase family protein [Deltaproteobacteria bacterium]|nr:MAG: polyprenyl synthetase family protein [Deltaproteobacteria bacterium]
MNKVSGYAQPQPIARAAVSTRRPRGIWSEEGLADVETLMLEVCSGSAFDRLSAMTSEHLASGGKRLRARLALGAVEALDGQRENATAWAASCELLHNATLLHDDVQDGDRVRRGSTATWVRHGLAQAINAGDLMLMLPYRVLDALPVPDAVKWHLSRTLAVNAERVARGQANEFDMLQLGKLDWTSYASATQGKTAALFGLPVEGAALIAGRTADAAAQLAAPFHRIGVLFQIQDDVLDLYGDKGRDVVGSDLYEGKVSALVSEHLRLHPEDRDWLIALLAAPRTDTSPAQVAKAIQRFRRDGALDAVWQRMARLEQAIDDDPLLLAEPRLHAVAMTLVAKAIAPIAHTAPRDFAHTRSEI